MGSLTGAVASQKVPEARDGEFKLTKYQFVSVIVYTCLTVRLTNQAGTKVGYSDPMILCGKGHRSTNKKYARDNRLIIL